MTPFSRLPSEPSHHESDQPSATPAEAVPPLAGSAQDSGRVHGSSVSFSEAFLDISPVRNTLPKQHRAHFDELRSSILAFCHDFKIPVSALSNKEAFGAELTSKKIPQERMSEAVLLFAQLEYLVTHKEPLKVESEMLREVESLYHLTEQYDSQVSLLERAGILKDGAIIGIDGKEYLLPTLEQIATRLFERESELSTKRDQGFTKLLLVPFGMSLDVLQETLKQFLLTYQQIHSDFILNINEPLWTWKEGYKGADTGDPPKIVYNPKSFDHNHEGQTKCQILEEQEDNQDFFPGWKVHLLQPSNPTNRDSKGFASIPREGQGQTQGKENPRPDLEAGNSPNEYLSTLRETQDNPNSPYLRESGLTPEDWIIAFMTHLEETGKPLDNYENDKERITYLTGAFFPSSSFVPYAYWILVIRQAYLSRGGSCSHDGSIGVRSSVIV